MTGSLAGHGASWPLPNVLNAAFHAALHRADLPDVHEHRRGARGTYAENARRDRKFGSLVTAGPFPVNEENRSRTWFFPRPQDLQDGTLQPSFVPTAAFDLIQSSLRDPLQYAIANAQLPSKDSDIKAWLCKEAFERYLEAVGDEVLREGEAVDDSDIFDHEHSVGIAIDPDTDTTGQGDAAGKIYSAQYLRLRNDWRLGVLAKAEDKRFRHDRHGNDLVRALFNGGQRRIVVGGQQRICTAEIVHSNGVPLDPQLPIGKIGGFHKSKSGDVFVKWVLLSPAVWPEILDKAKDSKQIFDGNGQVIHHHPGGWLPNWVNADDGSVLLRHRAGDRSRDYSGPKARRISRVDEPICARLVSALVPKPLVVTGWALPDEAADEQGGAQSTHLAVPAGAVYYFEAYGDKAEQEAEKLATTLNWHGADTAPATIKNRRSTLLGEKGFGLGVCGTWQFYEDVAGRSKTHLSDS